MHDWDSTVLCTSDFWLICYLLLITQCLNWSVHGWLHFNIIRSVSTNLKSSVGYIRVTFISCCTTAYMSGDCYCALLSPIVTDWDLYEQLLDHVLAKHVKTEAQYHPVLMSESPVRHHPHTHHTHHSHTFLESCHSLVVPATPVQN